VNTHKHLKTFQKHIKNS